MRLTTICFLTLFAVPSFAADTVLRVRAVDPTLAELIQDGAERSTTFAGLINQIERSDWFVFVQPGSCPDRAAVGCLLHIVGRSEGRLYVRLLVNPKGRHPDQVIVTLAHELQHAVEVVTSGSVTDGPSMLDLLRRISSSRVRTSKAVLYETAAARRAEEAVFRELRQR
jgi:hypothetical protein